MLAANLGPKLLRMKGIIKVRGEDRPAVIHGVQQIFHPVRWLEHWLDSDQRTRIVFITIDTPREEIEHFFHLLIGAVDDVLAEMKVEPERYRSVPLKGPGCVASDRPIKGSALE